MKKRRDFMTIILAIGAVFAVGTLGVSTFAWYQATIEAQIITSPATTGAIVTASSEILEIAPITVKGDTSNSASMDSDSQHIAMTDIRRLTDVSGNATRDKSLRAIAPVSLFKPVFVKNYASLNDAKAGYADIYDVSEQTTIFSGLTTGSAYPYVRFGFRVRNLSPVSHNLTPTYTLTESTGMHLARVSICQITVPSFVTAPSDVSNVERTYWTEKNYLDTEGENVEPVCYDSSNQEIEHYQIVDGEFTGATFNSYLGETKTANNASSGYTPVTPLASLAATGDANHGDYAFFSITIWIEGQDADAWSATGISDTINFSMNLV